MGRMDRATLVRERWTPAIGAVAFCLACIASRVVVAQALQPLRAYNVDPASVSVSGVSSGGAMAIQVGVAYSSRIMGVAAFAASPYDCQRAGNITVAKCQGRDVPDIEPLALNMQRWSGDRIDPVANLARQKVYLFVGMHDDLITGTVVGASHRLYQRFVAPGNLYLESTIDAGHTFPTDFDSPYLYRCALSRQALTNCGFDAAGKSLEWIYGPLVAPPPGLPDGEPMRIDQREFGSRSMGLDEMGLLYVPRSCAAGLSCKLHIFLHGCTDSEFRRNDQIFARYSGHSRWAEANGIVLLFPQIYPDQTLNPDGCWDTTGRYDEGFDQRGGGQVAGIMAMVARITSGYTGARAVEYRHAGWDHYFVTASADEIARLDAGVFAGWARTGESFGVYPIGTAGASNVCRFFSTSFDPKSSHFYATTSDECEKVKHNADWEMEGEVFSVPLPDSAGGCAAGLQPLFRLYNDGQGGAPNHRYTTLVTIRDAMLAQGWIAEGVTACVPG